MPEFETHKWSQPRIRGILSICKHAMHMATQDDSLHHTFYFHSSYDIRLLWKKIIMAYEELMSQTSQFNIECP